MMVRATLVMLVFMLMAAIANVQCLRHHFLSDREDLNNELSMNEHDSNYRAIEDALWNQRVAELLSRGEEHASNSYIGDLDTRPIRVYLSGNKRKLRWIKIHFK